VCGLLHATQYNIALSFSPFVRAALFMAWKAGMGTQPGARVHTPSILFLHFKRILNPELELEILVPNIPNFSNYISNWPIQGQADCISFKERFF
jgi:hypothetical protein